MQYHYDPNATEAPNKLVEEGDYVFEVDTCVAGISQGRSTAGSETLDLRLRLFTGEQPVGACYETLVDHEKTRWKLNAFIKCTGYTSVPGEVNLIPENIVGLRGHCHVYVDEYNGKKRNKVATFYTDRPRLNRRPLVQESDPFGS